MQRSKRLGLKTGLAAGLFTAAAAIAISIGVASYAAPSKTTSLVGAKVDNFMLPDQNGMGHELYYHSKAPAVVIVSTAMSDPASAKVAATLADLQKQFGPKGVEFLMLDSSLKDGRDALISGESKNPVPVLADELQLVGRSLGVTKANEVFVVNPKTWTVAYHGPVDSSTAAQKTKANLADALSAILAGQPVAVTEAAVKGAAIDFPDRLHKADFSKISYANDVAPILSAKCVTCHTKGGMGPFAMNSYETVKGFSPMIREALRTKRMPPFHSDTHWGQWTNNMLLSDAQVKTVVNWVEAGSPRGEGEDPLAKLNVTPPEWPLGQPDVVVQIPSFDVPAAGVIDYQDRSIATGLTEGKWLKATAWAGASATVHHALAGWIPNVDPNGRGFSWNVALGGYGPGSEGNLTPADTGIYVPPGGSYAWQMHYTANGKAIHDTTKVGYYFYKEQPKYILRQASVTDFSIEIPPGESRWHETAYLEFPHDALLFGTQPHCHARCYSTKLRIRYPDGTEKVILNQPRYEFSWQREYIFKDRFLVPAGSKLIADYVYDNSEGNKSNPDPKRDVPFGEQTMDEMLFTFVRYTWVGETSTNRHDDWQQELQGNVTFGALDDNMDGKIQKEELRNFKQFAPLKANFALVDANHDGGIDPGELKAAMAMMQKMRANAKPAAETKEDAGTAAMKQAATGGH